MRKRDKIYREKERKIVCHLYTVRRAFSLLIPSVEIVARASLKRPTMIKCCGNY